MNKVAKPRSRKNIRTITKMIRELCGLKDNLEFPILYFLEHILPKIFEDFVFCVVEDDELDCEAIAYPNSNEIIIRKSVYDGAFEGVYRDLFTIAHEIGHLFLHQETSISFARGRDIEIKTYENPEWQANTFAGELLAPPDLIQNMSIDEISKKCKVSRKTAEIQKSYCN
ncbi:MAG: ImmA/IrrE family metallo-endopeptidase [Tissierellaceae bacterium]|nr:ImmA/IrrE family metallo-endopeptidase [Tissierellaceae bacterium]